MNINIILGIAVIIIAYGATWFLLIKSKKRVDIIYKKGLHNLEEIKAEFDSGSEENNAS